MEKLRQQVIQMQRKVNDLLDAPGDPAARSLVREMQGLEDDMQVSKNPRSVEDRVKRIIQLVQGDAERNRIMNHEHLQMIERWAEDLRRTLQKM